MDGTKPLLWKAEESGNHALINTLFVLNSDLVKWISPGDKALSNTRLHGRIGVAECLYAMGRNDQAVVAAEDIQTAGLDADQREAVAWIRAISLDEQGRTSEAVIEYQFCADDVAFKYSKPAMEAMIRDLSRLKRADECARRFRQYLSRYHPDAMLAMELANCVESARING